MTDTSVTDTGDWVTDTWVVPDAATAPDTDVYTYPDTSDASPFKADRALTLLFGAPDLPGRFVCLGAFAPSADPTAVDAPASAVPAAGAYGVPDPSDPTNPMKTTAFQYGAVVPFPLTAEMIAALKVFKVVVYLLDENPAKSSRSCASMWKTVKDDTKRWKTFDPSTIKAGEHALLSMIGCVNGAPAGDTTGTCGPAGNFELRLDKLDVAKPTSPSDATIGLQFLHLSQFAGTSVVPGWNTASGVDVYVATVAGTTSFFKIANAVKFKDIAPQTVGVRLPAGATKDNSFLIVAATGTPPCINSGPPTTACPSYTLPLSPFLDPATGYPRVGGGLFPNTTQVVALIGSPVASATLTRSMRIAFARATAWP